MSSGVFSYRFLLPEIVKSLNTNHGIGVYIRKTHVWKQLKKHQLFARLHETNYCQKTTTQKNIHKNINTKKKLCIWVHCWSEQWHMSVLHSHVITNLPIWSSQCKHNAWSYRLLSDLSRSIQFDITCLFQDDDYVSLTHIITCRKTDDGDSCHDIYIAYFMYTNSNTLQWSQLVIICSLTR